MLAACVVLALATGVGCGGDSSEADARASLVADLDSEDRAVADAAATALVAQGKAAVDALQVAPGASLQQLSAIAFVLGQIGPDASPAAPWLIQRMRAQRHLISRGAESLGRMGEGAVAPVLGVLRPGTSAQLRAGACDALGLSATQNATAREGLLKTLQNDDDANVRARAAVALGRLGFREPAVLAALEAAASGPGLNGHFYPARALAALGEPGAAVLLRLMGHASSVVRTAAAGALGEPSEAALKPRLAALEAALADPSARVARVAAGALGEHGAEAKSALPALRAAAIRRRKAGEARAADAAEAAVEVILHPPSVEPDEDETEEEER